MNLIYFNGVGNEDLGWYVSDVGRPWSRGRRERGSHGVRGLAGRVPASTAMGEPRVTPVTLLPMTGDGSTVSGRQALLDRLWAHLEGALEVEWVDQPGRVRRCRVDVAEAEAAFREVSWKEGSGDLSVTLELIEDTPVAWSRESQVLAVGATPTPIPLGRAASVPLFRFAGTFTGVTITYRAQSGRVLSTLVVGGEVGATAYLEIDCSPFAGSPIVLSVAGVRTDRTDLFTSGDLGLTFDPRDGDPDQSVWPTIEANRAGVVEYAEAWL